VLRLASFLKTRFLHPGKYRLATEATEDTEKQPLKPQISLIVTDFILFLSNRDADWTGKQDGRDVPLDRITGWTG